MKKIINGMTHCLEILVLWFVSTFLENTSVWEALNDYYYPGVELTYHEKLTPDYFTEAANYGDAPWSMNDVI